MIPAQSMKGLTDQEPTNPLLWYVFYSSYYHTEFMCQARSIESAEFTVLVFQRAEGLDDPAKDWELLSIHEEAPKPR